MEETKLELKYCERCGALGLRRSQSSESYCEPCGRLLMESVSPRLLAARLGFGRSRRGRRRTPLVLGAAGLSFGTGGLQ